MTQQSVNSGAEPALYGSNFLSAYSDYGQQHSRWAERGGEETSSMLECSASIGDEHSIADCTPLRPVTPVTQRPCPSIPPPSSAVLSPMAGTCSPICSMCSPTDSDWDTIRSTPESPGSSEGDPVSSAAAHLHLLGESLSLIGLHLQETDKMLCPSSSLSLLLDSLLCALAPIICLTAQIPELRSCTQHTLTSTLENIAYLMPGL